MPEYNIALELAKLHALSGSAYSKQVESIAKSISVSKELSQSKSFYGIFMKKYST